ncbi:MAG: ferritin-like domain-containing protein [Solirubrobacteraceae bacterium]
MVAGLGSLSVAGAAAAGLESASGASPLTARDRDVLTFALMLEELQVAFYSQALRSGRVTGEARQFAEVVGAEERAHLAYLRQAAGSAATAAERYRFGGALHDTPSFVSAAVAIEETGVAAYNGQATNLSPASLARVARVISVEARHAAWARALAGRQPAPVPIDVPISAMTARAALGRYMG